MIELMHQLNTGAENLLHAQLWPMVWQSSLLIVLVALSNRTLFRRAAPQLRYALWGLVLLRLVVPPQLDLPTGVSHWAMPVLSEHATPLLKLKSPIKPEAPVTSSSTPQATPAPFTSTDPTAGLPSTDPTPLAMPISALLLGIWGMGAAFFVALLGAQLWQHRRLLRRSQPAPPWVDAAVVDCRQALRIRWSVRTRIVDHAASPALLGLFRPTILLPQSTLDTLETDQVKAILAHELAHVKRLDFLVNWVQVALGILYFFHPLLWWANREMRRERELACDDLTLIALGLNRTGYAESLLRVAENLVDTRRFAPVHVGVFESKGELTSRLKRILDQRKHPAPRLTALSAIAVVIFAALFGTWHRTDAAPNAKGAITDEAPDVEMRAVEAKVIDSAGNPVEGAELTPFFLRTDGDPGSSFGTHVEAPGRTNASGIAEVPYPRFVKEQMECSVVAVKVEHPGYAVIDRVELAVDGSSAPIQMERGGTLRVSGFLPTSPGAVQLVRAELYGTAHSGWEVHRDGSIVRRNLQSGPHCVMLVYEDPGGATFFSMPKDFEIKREEAHEYKLQLYEGGSLSGILDPSVPRPVKNGWVEVRVRPEHLVGSQVNLPGSVEWNGSASVNADGTFEVSGLPRGHAEVTAACEGAVANGERPDGYTSIGFPVVTTLDGLDDHIEVPVIRTATAAIRLKDSDGNPVPNARVDFWPNIMYFGRYTTVFGQSIRFVESDDALRKLEQAEGRPFSATSDKSGVVTINNLPPWVNQFAVESDTHELPMDERGRRDYGINLIPGEITESTVELVPKGTSLLTSKTESPTKPMPEGLQAAINRQREEANRDPFARPTSPASPANQLRGRVVDEAGQPLAGVLVDAWTWCPGKETNTTADGNFVLDEFDRDQNTIEIRFSKAGYSPAYMFRQPLGELDQPITLTKRTYLTGTVVDSAGNPVAGVLLRANGGGRDAEGVHISEIITETNTADDGTYHLPVQEGTYTLSIADGDEYAQLPGVDVDQFEGKTLDIQLEPAATFRARVVDALTENPVADVRLTNWRRKEIDGTSGPDGLVEISGVPEGQIEVDIKGEEQDITRWWSQDALKEWERKKIDLESKWQRNFDDLTFNVSHNMDPVTIVVERGARIRGQVLDPEGNPVAGATVAPAKTGSGNSITGDTRFSVETDDKGHFDMLLPASKYRAYNIIAHDGDYKEWRKWANGVMEPITTQPGDLLEDVVLRLQPPCTIRGKAVDAHGEAVADRQVRAMSTSKDDNRYYVPTSRTREDGSFEITHVAPGEHFVQADPFWLDPSEAPEGTSQIVTVSPESPATDVLLIAKPD